MPKFELITNFTNSLTHLKWGITFFHPDYEGCMKGVAFVTVLDFKLFRIQHHLEHLLRKVDHCTVSLNISPVFRSQKHATLDPKFRSSASQTYIPLNYQYNTKQ